jgi:hypothetical protein
VEAAHRPSAEEEAAVALTPEVEEAAVRSLKAEEAVAERWNLVEVEQVAG